MGETTLYGCGALVCYSSVEPIEVEVDGARVRAKWRASDGNLIVPLGPRGGDARRGGQVLIGRDDARVCLFTLTSKVSFTIRC